MDLQCPLSGKGEVILGDALDEVARFALVVRPGGSFVLEARRRLDLSWGGG